MQAIRVKEKVKVFISSNIGEKYAYIREALKLLLTETNMCEVYMFEDEGAASTDVVSSYMRKLERSDIVVYLIDNKDGIGEGTLKEVKRGRELKKKSLFLFCDENEKESTELQKEIIKMKGGEKFRVVSKFVNMPEIAYESVINDIIDTYLYYCNMPVEISGSLNEGSSIETTIGDIHAILNKDAYKNYDYTKWTLRREISAEPEYSRKIETFDKLCSDLLSVVLGNIPICDDEYFEDDIVGRFVKFVEVVYGEDTLQENLKFVADALGGKGQPKDVIRNYFLNGFYGDHCKLYQKRPIYWLFDSGKKNGFKCLIYMHRYQPDTIARIRTDYVHEQQSRYRTAVADIEQRLMGASGSEKVKLDKQKATLQAQITEIGEYEERIHHLADQMIRIDLDDGVKNNYEIFKDVLAKIK